MASPKNTNAISDEIKKALPIALVAIIVGLGLYFWKSFYIQLEDYERGVVLQAGTYRGKILTPGWHFRLPFPIEKVYIVDVISDKKINIGFKEDEIGQKIHLEREALTLTKYGNLVDLEMVVNYFISDPAQYLLEVDDPDLAMRQISESAMRMVVGLYTIDDALTERKREIVDEIQKKIQSLVEEYKLGIKVRRVQFVKAVNPRQVIEAFEDVENAKQDSGKAYLDAQRYANQKLPEAKGNARKQIEEAKGYAESVVARAQGDSARFTQILDKYTKYKKVTRKRLYLETMDEVLPKINKIIVDPNSNSANILPLKKL